ncbi:hypothetical protein [uncultured Cohaesibacter sp.]|uniref:hypothetical protein n=1 Tax=uncultured Cohaesibacter sp. TaxID=1002546 RepID=UPI0029C9898D|nr:hypothetical protein [uncultured Cohaesibacter sp.]
MTTHSACDAGSAVMPMLFILGTDARQRKAKIGKRLGKGIFIATFFKMATKPQ